MFQEFSVQQHLLCSPSRCTVLLGGLPGCSAKTLQVNFDKRR
jgi:hypothetical protein